MFNKWVVVLVGLALAATAVTSYTVDVDHPPRRGNDYDVDGGGLQVMARRGGGISRTIEDQIIAAKQKRMDARRPAAFISGHGYPVEEYKVTTADGYILTLFRIPHGAKNATGYGGHKEPVFVQHGLLSSAMDFLVTGPERALGFVLADAGYDVWLGNTRGSTYSRQHRDLSPDERRYWQFSWHEIGERDLPTMINYVLARTGYKKLHYVGHSQGTTAYFVMCNQWPRMQEKIQTMNALAPIAYMRHLYSPLVRAMAPHSDRIVRLYTYAENNGEVMGRNDLMRMAGYELCRTESRFNQLCANIIYLLGGWGSNQLDAQQIADIVSYSPASSSVFQLAHYGQGVLSGDFGFYDFGVQENQRRYGRPSPPVYDPARITSRVALHYSDNDWLAAVVDVEQLANKLQQLVGNYRVPDSKFNHMDFCWGKDAKSYVYDKVIGVMRRFPIPEIMRGGTTGDGDTVGVMFMNNQKNNMGIDDGYTVNGYNYREGHYDGETRDEERMRNLSTAGWGIGTSEEERDRV